MAAKQVAEHAIAVFSKSYCPFCKRAKGVISSLNIDKSKVGVMELDERNDGSDIQGYLKEKTNQGTVPNIFISGKHLGGCDSLMSAQSSGELDKLVASL